MLTIDNVRAIPWFSTLAESGLERPVRTSADMHLEAGEFAVPEGAEHAHVDNLAGLVKLAIACGVTPS